MVIPLIEGFPRADRLNPVLQINEIEAVLATRFIISARRDALDVTDINLDAERDAIIRAIDVLVGGI